MPIALADIDTNVANTPIYTLGFNVDLIVVQGVRLSTSGANSEVVLGTSNNDIRNFGEIYALASEAIVTSITSRIVNGVGAVIASANDTAIEFNDGGAIINDGTVAGQNAIRTDTEQVQIENHGFIDASLDAIQCGGNLRLTNSGTITALGGTAVEALGTDHQLVNTGLISTAIAGFSYAINVYNSSPTARAIIVNSGTIQGAVLLTDGDDVYDGADGLLIGDVTGFDGDDSIASGAGRQVLFGVDGDDSLSAGAGNDELRGGIGDDLLDGGDGDDLLRGEAGADQIVGGAGMDRVVFTAAVTASLADATQNTGQAAGDSYSGIEGLIGSSAADTLTGDGFANWLDGGLGADSLTGGAGDDRYELDTAGDLIVEAANGGNDLAVASVSYTLGAGVALETLRARGAAGLALGGNELANRLFGGAGNDTLAGGDGVDQLFGGEGADRLDGGLGADRVTTDIGADVIVFSTALVPGNVDRLLDFASVNDQIELDDAVFAGLAPGALPAGAFRTIGVDANTAAVRIVYNPADGALYFDADGSGAGAALRFATLNVNTTLTAADFTVI